MYHNLFQKPNHARHWFASFAVCLTALMVSTTTVRADVIADSFDDWSTTGTQGENRWENGYYNQTADLNGGGDGEFQTREFIPFPNDGGPPSPTNFWTGTKWDWFQGNQPWTEIGQENTHPNGSNWPEVHWTIRRWTSDTTAPLELTWQMRKLNLNCGNGVTGKLFVNGNEVDTATIASNDGVGVTRMSYVNIVVGDLIDLALTPTGTDGTAADGCDGSAFRLTMNDTIPDGAGNRGEKLADSMAEFSGTHGQDGWRYGYYDVGADAANGIPVEYDPSNDFTEFLVDGSGVVSADPAIGAWKNSPNHWDGFKWDLLSNAAPVGHGPWTEVSTTGGHPAANAQGDPEVHWAMRRWISDFDGEIQITGRLGNGSDNGDGTVGRIFVDGTEIFSQVTDGNSVGYAVNSRVSVGSIVEFAIDADAADAFDEATGAGLADVNDGSDSTVFTATIYAFEPFNVLTSDLNNNGFVDFEDLTILLANWNKDVTAADGNLVEPLVTVVNFADLTVLLADWTGPGPAGAPEAALGEAVPEPSTLLLGVMATLGLSFYRRRKRRAF